MLYLLVWYLALVALPHCLIAADIDSEVVYQFPEPLRIENFAIRSNGDLLLNILLEPSLYSLDPVTRSPNLIHKFPDATGLYGIAEVSPDVFAVIVGNYSLAIGTTVPHSQSVYQVTFEGLQHHVEKVTDIPEGLLLNGIEGLLGENGAVLIADSRQGAVLKLDMGSGVYDVAIQVPEMAPPADAAPQVGVNGLNIRDGFLYWTNSDMEAVYRIEIDDHGYALPNAESKLIVNVGQRPDDFTFDSEGNIWVTTHRANTLVVANVDGEVSTVLGSSSEMTVAGATACRFGRREGEEEILYVVTDGAHANPVNGTVTEGGKVVAVDVSGA
ncbi:hypothetical protein FQN54_009410 [Arachnomyces sp. PD_36]|nr:hypothetical protein FQN54_009410 [Arachnomyces sp. PD_36]